MVSHICSVCGTSYDTRKGLGNHLRGSCGKQATLSLTIALDKRRQDRHKQAAAKVQRTEDELTALRERELIRDNTVTPDIPVCFHIVTSVTVYSDN